MKCPECQTEVNEQLEYCPNCGAPLHENTSEANEEQHRQHSHHHHGEHHHHHHGEHHHHQEEAEYDSEPQLSRRMIIFIIAGTLLLIGLVTFGYMGYTSPHSKDYIIDPDTNLLPKPRPAIVEETDTAKADTTEKKTVTTKKTTKKKTSEEKVDESADAVTETPTATESPAEKIEIKPVKPTEAPKVESIEM